MTRAKHFVQQSWEKFHFQLDFIFCKWLGFGRMLEITILMIAKTVWFQIVRLVCSVQPTHDESDCVWYRVDFTNSIGYDLWLMVYGAMGNIKSK